VCVSVCECARSVCVCERVWDTVTVRVCESVGDCVRSSECVLVVSVCA